MRSAMVAVVGRPNVGKSSLVNALIGRKISIVTPKPQTTRHRIQGALHDPRGQLVFIDTPGLHRKTARALNRYLNETAAGTLGESELVVFVVEAGRWTEEDEAVVERLKTLTAPVGLVVNKVDRFADKERLLPELERLSALLPFAFVVPLSATKRDNLKALTDALFALAQEGPALYPEHQIVGHDLSFTISETVREKLIRALAQELPYALTVEVEALEQEGALLKASAVIWIEREGQKKIVIGENGVMLKRVGTAARRELEYLTGSRVFLKLWVRVKENWTDDPGAMARLGYVQ